MLSLGQNARQTAARQARQNGFNRGVAPRPPRMTRDQVGPGTAPTVRGAHPDMWEPSARDRGPSGPPWRPRSPGAGGGSHGTLLHPARTEPWGSPGELWGGTNGAACFPNGMGRQRARLRCVSDTLVFVDLGGWRLRDPVLGARQRVFEDAFGPQILHAAAVGSGLEACQVWAPTSARRPHGARAKVVPHRGSAAETRLGAGAADATTIAWDRNLAFRLCCTP